MPYKDPEKRRKYHREYQRKMKYGVSPEDISLKLELQNGKCAICTRVLEPGKGTHLDHDHETNKPRGLLCYKCNHALGLLNEDLRIVYNLISYLLKYR